MDEDSAEYEWFFFRKKYVVWTGSKETYLELAELIPADNLLADLVNILKEPVFSAESSIKRHAVLGLLAFMPLTPAVVRAIGSGMDDGSKYVVLQAMLILCKIEIDSYEILESLLPFLEKAKEIVQRDENKKDQTLRVAAAAMLVSHNQNRDVAEYAEIILRNIHPKSKFVMHMAIELGLQLQIIENEGDA